MTSHGDARRTRCCITPTLFLGPPEARVWLRDLHVTGTAEEALKIILGGGSALLPVGAWDTAREVMRALGCSEEWIENRFHFARTGVVPESSKSSGPDSDSK